MSSTSETGSGEPAKVEKEATDESTKAKAEEEKPEKKSGKSG